MYSRGKIIARLVNSMDQFHSQTEVGDLLISTARDAYNSESFIDSLTLFRREMRKLFPKGVSVVTRSDSGRLHCHAAVLMPVPCTMFDWTSFNESERYYKLYKTYLDRRDLRFFRYYTRKYRASLPSSWLVINRKLMLLAKRYGLGRVFLTPVKKNMEAIKWYYVSNIPYKKENRDKGLHYFTNWGMTNISGFQLANKFTRDYRDRLRKFSEGLQLNSDDYNILLRSVLGRRWYFKCKNLILNINKLSISEVMQYNELKSMLRIHLMRSS